MEKKSIRITFLPDQTAAERNIEIQKKLNELGKKHQAMHVTSAWLFKEGYDNIEFGYDEDLRFADGIIIEYKHQKN